MGKDRQPRTPYGSAHDLPSAIEMRRALPAMKAVALFSRDFRKQAKDIDAQYNRLFDTVDRYCEVLGPRHWIFTNSLPVDDIGSFIWTASPEEAETAIVEVIAERLADKHWQIGLNGHEALRARRVNLERAREHYLNGHWDSSALMVVTAMDGFVSDVEPGARKGLHARDPDEMVPWDSVAGHHLGLSAVMKVFLQPFYRRHEEEVFEVHRHGIVHGMIVNYDNQIVATKAWNMLAAVADWATALEKADAPQEPKPTWRDVLKQVTGYAADQRYRDTFTPSSAQPNEDGFDRFGAVEQATRFLEAWKAQRWGIVVEALPRIAIDKSWNPGRKALFAKDVYEDVPLLDYAISRVSFTMASCAAIEGTATIGGTTGPFEIRWMYQTPEGDLAQPEQNTGRWVLAVYPPQTFM